MTAAGGWHEVAPDWRRAAEAHCELCGRLLARRRWVAEVAGAARAFCDPDCAELYRTYWLPRYATAP